MDRSIIQFWSQTSTSAGNQGPRGILRLIPVLPQVLLDSANTRKGDQARKRNWLKAWLSSNNTRAFNPSIHRGNLTTGGWLDRSHPCTVYSSCSFLRIVFHSVFPYFFPRNRRLTSQVTGRNCEGGVWGHGAGLAPGRKIIPPSDYIDQPTLDCDLREVLNCYKQLN